MNFAFARRASDSLSTNFRFVPPWPFDFGLGPTARLVQPPQWPPSIDPAPHKLEPCWRWHPNYQVSVSTCSGIVQPLLLAGQQQPARPPNSPVPGNGSDPSGSSTRTAKWPPAVDCFSTMHLPNCSGQSRTAGFSRAVLNTAGPVRRTALACCQVSIDNAATITPATIDGAMPDRLKTCPPRFKTCRNKRHHTD